MTKAAKQTSGVLGRGPFFWGALTLLSTALVVGLGVSEAIEGKGVLIMLMLIPITNFIAMMRSAYMLASSAEPGCLARGAAQQRYIKRVAICTSLYVLGFAATEFLGNELDPPRAVIFVFAVLTGLAVSGVFWATGRLIIEETDEFIRVLTIRQTLIASAIALSSASIWGFLEAAELVVRIDAYWFAMIWFFGLMIGAAVNRVEHGTWGAL